MKCLYTAIAITLLMSSGCSTMPSRTATQPSPLVVANCPKLTALPDDTFGASVSKLVEISGIYYKCRAAALAGLKEDKK